jgi:hypothetical protein
LRRLLFPCEIPCKLVQFSRIFLKMQSYLWIIWVKLAGVLWIIGWKIRQLINILFCGYRRSEIGEPCRNIYSPGAQVPQRVINTNIKPRVTCLRCTGNIRINSTPTAAVQKQCLPTNCIPFTIFVLFYRIIASSRYSGYSENVKFGVWTSEFCADYIAYTQS